MELKIIQVEEDKTNPKYASPDCQEIIDAMKAYYPQIGFHLPWVGYFVFDGDQVVGAGGFTGRPKAGVVEIAYGTFKNFEHRGIASFTCSELVRIAKKSDSEIIITAKTRPEDNASTKILRKNGFIYKEIVQDHEIGDAWLWELSALKKLEP